MEQYFQCFYPEQRVFGGSFPRIAGKWGVLGSLAEAGEDGEEAAIPSIQVLFCKTSRELEYAVRAQHEKGNEIWPFIGVLGDLGHHH